jgi:GR25 family glycosyltransferase involved in LPS biosynthesis
MNRIVIEYINLDRAKERKERFESDFRNVKITNRWDIHRFSAIDGEGEIAKNWPGAMSGSIKGCCISHIKCISKYINADTHLFICEDDTKFCPQSARIIENIVDSAGEDDWDIIFTDVTLLSAVSYPMVYKLVLEADLANRIYILNIDGFPYGTAGSGAYIINKKSIGKLYEEIMASCGSIDHPYDIVLMALIKYKKIKGFFTVPFLTAPSILADGTQVGLVNKNNSHSKSVTYKINQDLIHAFKRLVWLGYENDAVLSEQINLIGSVLAETERDKLFQKIMPWSLFCQKYACRQDYSMLNIFPVEVEISSNT